MRRVVGFIFIVLLLNSCGYKPTAIYTKNVLGDKIYANVEISLEDPENSILIKDAINEAIINKFHSKLVSKDKASSTIDIKLSSVKFQPIEYDTNGYVIAYKTLVGLQTTYSDKNSKMSTISTTGDYDFNIESLSVISDSKRFNAIKEASQKAIDAFISKISIRGVK
jgi:hypothetical protein